MRARAIAAVAAVAMAMAGAAGCGDGSGGDGTRVSATTGIVADITGRVAGPDAEVVQVIPDSVSPHEFSLSARDRAEIEDSDLLVANGADLEAGVPLDEIDVGTFALADHVGELRRFEDDGGDEPHGAFDPHVWMDPACVAAAVPALADALTEADPGHAAGYRRRGRRYARELRALDSEIEADLAAIPERNRKLVTSHDALGYFAARYGFEVVGAPFPASGPESEPSATSVRDLEERIRESGVPAVFAEETDDPEVLRQIGDDTGVEVVTDLLVETPGDAGDYLELLRRDAALLRQALDGPVPINKIVNSSGKSG